MISRRQSVLSGAPDILAALRASGLLPVEAVEALAAGPLPPDPRAWTAGLVERGLLTGYQAEQLLAGNAHHLVLGHYRILDALGAGGMGRVYKAEHALMRRVVALKLLGPAEGASPSATGADLTAAFGREIEVSARLSHPNIVAAYDAGQAKGVRFLVLEYVDGVDLERLVRTVGPLSPRRACEHVRQTALALQYACERGVLHRDVKPANLLVESADDPRSVGRVKVLDLGLALSLRDSDDGAAAAGGHLSGTPDYLAPEVAHNPDSRDVRSDLYSLGCTFYYLLTGRVPFPGGTWTEKLLRHQYDAPAPLRDLAPAVPAAVAAVVERLMAKAPAERYGTPAAVARALEDWLARGEDPPAAVALPAFPTAPSPTPPPGSGRAPRATPVVHSGPPSAWHVPVPAPSRPKDWLRMGSWLLVTGAAVAAGLGGALLLRGCLTAEHTPGPPPLRPGFVVESSATTHATLAAALAEAVDGDTVVLSGDGPFATAPLSITGKALTLRAAAGSHPVLHLDAPAGAWKSLLATDRPLELEGIELRRAPGGEPTHLVCATGASLRLVRCRVTAPQHAAPVVARGVGRVELRDCELVAGELVLCVEVGRAASCAIGLAGNRIEAQGAGAAAISVWAAGPCVGGVDFDLEGNTIRGSRILSLCELSAGVTVAARGNHLEFEEALLCANGFGEPDGWRRAVTCHGQGNDCRGGKDWLCIDGQPAGAACGLALAQP
jgi:serine/threonine protein kinase